jgi:hypothetical protein
VSGIRRREFVILLGGATAAWPLVARAQPSGKTYRIGFLGPGSYAERKRDVDALRTGLRRLGYEEGRNIDGPKADTTASPSSQPSW